MENENLIETFYIYESDQNDLFINKKNNLYYLGCLIGTIEGIVTADEITITNEDTFLKEGQIVAISDSDNNVKIKSIQLNS